jgi:hypothetical protein
MDNVVEFVTSGTSSFASRFNSLPHKGVEMMVQAVAQDRLGTRMPLRAPGTSGLRPSLVAHGQGSDVYKHIVFNAGAGLAQPPAAAAMMAWDRLQAVFSSESRSEVRGDIAGTRVATAIMAWAVTGDTPTLRRRIRTTLCQ